MLALLFNKSDWCKDFSKGSSKFWLKGGSQKTISKWPFIEEILRASCLIICKFSALSRALFFLNCCTTCGCLSIMVTEATPLDSASNPRAPLPAKRSRQQLPGNIGVNQLNKVSRIREELGLNPSTIGNSNFLLRHFPAMIRRLPVPSEAGDFLDVWFLINCVLNWLSAVNKNVRIAPIS